MSSSHSLSSRLESLLINEVVHYGAENVKISSRPTLNDFEKFNPLNEDTHLTYWLEVSYEDASYHEEEVWLVESIEPPCFTRVWPV